MDWLAIFDFLSSLSKAQVEKEQAIADSTSELRKSYKCELCDKQYIKYSEYDNHLNSYDHHHRQVRDNDFVERFSEFKRLKDLRQYETGRRFGSHRSMGEIQEKRASRWIVAKERAQMKVERFVYNNNYVNSNYIIC